MDNIKLDIFSSRDLDVDDQHSWSGLTTGAACGCTSVSQHSFSVVMWLFCAVESSQLTYVTTVPHAVSTDTREKTKYYKQIWS